MQHIGVTVIFTLSCQESATGVIPTRGQVIFSLASTAVNPASKMSTHFQSFPETVWEEKVMRKETDSSQHVSWPRIYGPALHTPVAVPVRGLHLPFMQCLVKMSNGTHLVLITASPERIALLLEKDTYLVLINV